jgi:misacylated tRNA(Ala) deacylase
MAVPGRRVPASAPAELARTELFAVDAYLRDFGTVVEEVDADQSRVRLGRTAFYPGGGGQPYDLGVLRWGDQDAAVVRVGRDNGKVWHWLQTDDLPSVGTDVHGELDWERRHLTMRTHTALHILCGVMWADHRVAVTGGNMDPGKGRLDFPLESMSAEFGRQVERRINDEIVAAREILVEFIGREVADPHRGQPDPARDRPAAGDRHRRAGQAGRRWHARAQHGRGRLGRGHRYRVQGQRQQTRPPGDPPSHSVTPAGGPAPPTNRRRKDGRGGIGGGVGRLVPE